MSYTLLTTPLLQLPIAQKHHLKEYRHGLELANVRMAFMKQEKGKIGMRFIKQTLASTPKEDFVHRYNLQLLLLDHLNETANGDFFKVAQELENEAKAANHTQLVHLVQIARVKGHFAQRKWDRLAAVLDECEKTLGLEDESTDSADDPWKATLTAHFLLFRGLHYGRAGEDQNAKAHFKRLYKLMDDAAESGVFNEMRRNGGVVNMSFDGSGQQLLVQSTPINVLYALTYLATVVSRRDFMGPDPTCRTLVHARAMREWEKVARADDLWDSGCESRPALLFVC